MIDAAPRRDKTALGIHSHLSHWLERNVSFLKLFNWVLYFMYKMWVKDNSFLNKHHVFYVGVYIIEFSLAVWFLEIDWLVGWLSDWLSDRLTDRLNIWWMYINVIIWSNKFYYFFLLLFSGTYFPFEDSLLQQSKEYFYF